MSEPAQSADGGYLSITRGAPSKPNWTGLFALLFKHSSCQQPLVASALAKIAEDPEQREAIAQVRASPRNVTGAHRARLTVAFARARRMLRSQPWSLRFSPPPQCALF